MAIHAILADVGGVLLTNGWDHRARARAVERFQLDAAETDSRHHETFDTYEIGKITLERYLKRVVFYQPRTFTMDDFIRFMFEQSHPFPEMIEFVSALKSRYRLRVGLVSNEGRELTRYRIDNCGLRPIADFFLFSSFVGLRKPDEALFRLALDLIQAKPEETAYLDDRPMFADVASSLGMHGIHHTDLESTRATLASLGLAAEN